METMLKEKTGHVLYQTTNENLGAIVNGLDVNENDIILAICGSGDQAFALLENAAKVIAVDNKPEQTEYVCERVNSLLSNIDKFWFPFGEEWDYIRLRNKYFKKPGRLSKIKSKLSHLEIIEADIFDLCRKENSFSKIYLSGVFFKDKELIRAVKSLYSNGLIYYTSVSGVESHTKEKIQSITPELELDKTLTSIAQEYEPILKWKPLVYRKRQ